MVNIKPVTFVTFGMFIIDEIEWQDSNKESRHNLIGGAGTYAVLGARIASSPCQLLSRSISWIVDVGSDFPADIRATIDDWNTDCNYRNDASRLTTRAWNGYDDNEFRSFRYLTPKIRLEVSSLNDRQLRSRSFHMVCSPQRCIDLTTKLRKAREHLSEAEPVVVWEPIPDLCTLDELQTLSQALQHCTVVSPNHEELKMFFPEADDNQAKLVSELMGWESLHSWSGDQHTAVAIIREGASGSTAYLAATDHDTATSIHIPAYHDASLQSSVVDPTGAGNTYLGALALALAGELRGQPTYDFIRKKLGLDAKQRSHHVAMAMIYATVAASFIIEQNGVPTLQQIKVFTEIQELWNGEKFVDRLNTYMDREIDLIRGDLASP